MTIESGSKIYTSEMKRFTLGDLIKMGGAGSVFTIQENPDLVAKIYHSSVDKETYGKKIECMVASAPDLSMFDKSGEQQVHLAWPLQKMYDEDLRFVGFSMPRLEIENSIELEYIIQGAQPSLPHLPNRLDQKITIAENLCRIVNALHGKKCYIVDLKPVNIHFNKKTLAVSLLDCDGFSVDGVDTRYTAPQFTPEYLAPEFQDVAKIPEDQEVFQDRFALAVIIFKLLNFGIHPFSGKSKNNSLPTDIAGRILARCYAYGVKQSEMVAPNITSVHTLFPEHIRMLFDKSFADGQSERTEAYEWLKALQIYTINKTKMFAMCMNGHVHFSGSSCMECYKSKVFEKLVLKLNADASLNEKSKVRFQKIQYTPDNGKKTQKNIPKVTTGSTVKKKKKKQNKSNLNTSQNIAGLNSVATLSSNKTLRGTGKKINIYQNETETSSSKTDIFHELLVFCSIVGFICLFIIMIIVTCASIT